MGDQDLGKHLPDSRNGHPTGAAPRNKLSPATRERWPGALTFDLFGFCRRYSTRTAMKGYHSGNTLAQSCFIEMIVQPRFRPSSRPSFSFPMCESRS